MTLPALLAVLALGVWGAYGVLAAPQGPTVSSITLNTASPTNASSVSWKVTFSASVTGVAVSNFSLVQTGVSSASVTGVSGSGALYTVTANTGAGSGTLGLNLSSAGSIKDSSNRGLQGVPYTGPAFTIDRAAPTATVTFPANGGLYNAASYNAGCSPTGICGAASDAAGVASVRVSVKGPNGKYWSAGSFSSTPEVFNAATNTTNWNYALPLSPEGAYVVHVQAADTFGNAQTGTTYAASSSFSLDLTPPAQTPIITAGPTNGSMVASTNASFSFTDSEPGVTLQCQLDAGAWAACTSPRSYSGLGQGGHTFSVRGVDPAGNPGTSASRNWTVDTVAPPAPTLTDEPDDPNSSAISTFAWTDSESPLTFMCSVENGPYQSCTSPFTFTVTVNTSNNGQHQFAVIAIDQAGNQSAATTYKWKVDGKQFTITGSLSDASYPGRIAPLNLVITNPNNFAITVSNVTVTVEHGTSKASCDGPTNLVVDHTLVGTVTVPGNTTKSLMQLSIPQANWPELEFADLGGNQDACKGATFTLDYTGSATK